MGAIRPIRQLYSDALNGNAEPPSCRGCRHLVALPEAPGDGVCRRFKYKPVEEVREDEELCGFYGKEFETKGRLSHYLVFAVPFSILLMGSAFVQAVCPGDDSVAQQQMDSI
jgi:hypothetical protein